jgi:hypothetical protein
VSHHFNPLSVESDGGFHPPIEELQRRQSSFFFSGSGRMVMAIISTIRRADRQCMILIVYHRLNNNSFHVFIIDFLRRPSSRLVDMELYLLASFILNEPHITVNAHNLTLDGLASLQLVVLHFTAALLLGRLWVALPSIRLSSCSCRYIYIVGSRGVGQSKSKKHGAG